MAKKKKEWKVKFSKQVKKQMEKMNKKDRKMFDKAIKKIKKDPTKTGKKLRPVGVVPWDNERCECRDLYVIWMDKDDEEVYFTCPNNECGGFWMTKKELAESRKKYLLDMVKDEVKTGELIKFAS